MLELTYNGHANFTLTDGVHTIIFDPWFTGNPSAKSRAGDVGPLDAILVTHGHGDHLGDAVELSKTRNAVIIAPNELALFCQRRGAKVHPMNPGGKKMFEFGLVRMTTAEHSSAFTDRGTEYTGVPCGFIVEMGGKKLYFAGDTALTFDMKLIPETCPVDIALLPIGDNFTMGPEEAARAVDFIKPGYVVPMHYGTFEVLEQTPDRFVELVKKTSTVPVALGIGKTHRFD